MAKEYSADTAGLHELKDAALDELWENSRAKKALTELTDDRIREILAAAELLCLDLLEGDE